MHSIKINKNLQCRLKNLCKGLGKGHCFEYNHFPISYSFQDNKDEQA